MHARKSPLLRGSRGRLGSPAYQHQPEGTVGSTMPAVWSNVCHVASGSAVLVATLPPPTSSTTLSELDTKKYNSTRPRLSEIPY